MTQLIRQTIFISHANPADNDAAAWLAAKLAVLGYQVWVDVEKLKGGETIWRTIEPVLRSDARCMILILSRSAFGTDGLVRQGIANEIELALSLERQFPRFILPWILDDLPFDRLPIQLSGRLCIPERRWSSALHKILEYLDSLQLQPSPNAHSKADILNRLLISERTGLSSEVTTYDLNQIACIKLPTKIFSIEDDLSNFRDKATGSSFKGRRLSFHAIEGPTRLFGKGVPDSIEVAHALKEGIANLDLSRWEVERIIVELVKKALYVHLCQKGLVQLGRANRSPVFYFNSQTVPAGKVSIRLPEKTRSSFRNVWGKHKDIYWHLGVEVNFSLVNTGMVTLIPHILFTKDCDREALDEDPKRDRRKQLQRRRAIAKLWFNDKWRGFYYPFLEHVKEMSGTIQINFEGNTQLELAGSLSTLLVPVNHVSVTKLQPDDYFDVNEDEDFES